jgi:hypothetical protein
MGGSGTAHARQTGRQNLLDAAEVALRNECLCAPLVPGGGGGKSMLCRQAGSQTTVLKQAAANLHCSTVFLLTPPPLALSVLIRAIGVGEKALALGCTLLGFVLECKPSGNPENLIFQRSLVRAVSKALSWDHN